MNNSKLYAELLTRLNQELKLLPDKPEETADSTLRALWHAAAGTPKSASLACIEELPVLDQPSEQKLRDFLETRLRGAPLAHIIGRQRFMEMEMLAGPEALVPRKETELLARAALELAQQIPAQQAPFLFADVCTGSGNIALTLAWHMASARIFAADISAPAVGLARRNALHLKLEGRVKFLVGDLLAPFESPDFYGKIDLITCNPPYINSARVEQMPNEISAHEPHAAFDGGIFGIAIILRLIQDAPRFLRKNGWLASEVGLGQGPALVKRLRHNPAYQEVREIHDETGAVRVILARC